jgi:uncharacterized protein
MKIAVDKIKDEPIELTEDIPASSWQMDSFDVKFAGDIHVEGKFTKVSREILTDVEVTLYRDITCSRCLGQANQAIKQSFRKSYNIDSLEEYLDIDDDIREEVLLNFPMKVLCKPDCKGICSKCGANLNQQECRCQEVKDNSNVS